MNTKRAEALIKEYVCPGCLFGSSPDTCGKLKTPAGEDFSGCENHIPATQMGIGNTIALGMPTGFNKPGVQPKRDPSSGWEAASRMTIRVWPKDEAGKHTVPSDMWDRCNVPVWFKYDADTNVTLVRTFMPRQNRGVVDIIDGNAVEFIRGKFPCAYDVSEFEKEID